jgi:predicted deacetylase
MKLILEFDDFHWDHPENCIVTINKLINYSPSVKISLFTVPNLREKPIYLNKNWCSEVSELISNGNLELCRHGFDHSFLEFKEIDYKSAYEKLVIGDYYFQKADLNCKKVFRAPYWGMSEFAVNALNDLDYTHLYNHEEYSHLDKSFNGEIVRYTWNLADSYINNNTNIVIAHGHTHNVCGNGIEECFNKICEFISNFSNIDYTFASEFTND